MSERIPKYRLHKASGQAFVQINGRRIYLGKHGTEASKEKYRRIVTERLTSKQVPVPEPSAAVGQVPHSISINEFILNYWNFAESYYLKDGKPTKELAAMRDALMPPPKRCR